MEQNSKKINYKDAEVTIEIVKVVNTVDFGEIVYTGSKVLPLKYTKMSDLVEKIHNINSKGIVMPFKDLQVDHKSGKSIYIAPIDINMITIKYLSNDRPIK